MTEITNRAEQIRSTLLTKGQASARKDNRRPTSSIFCQRTARQPSEYHIRKCHQQRRQNHDDNHHLPKRRADQRKEVKMPTVHKRDGMSDEARIAKRLRPSNDEQTADTHTTMGTGPTRVHHTIHRSGQNLVHDNPHSRSVLRSDADADIGDVINRSPVAGPPNFGRKGK
jgi:hypothetical protein